VRYVRQEDPMGCMIAAAAMVLDMTYQEAAEKVPLQDASDLVSTGVIAIEKVRELGQSMGWAVIDLEKPYILQNDCRYILVIPRELPPLCHAVAVDEFGCVVDPDCGRESGKQWSDLEVVGLLEFRRI